MIDTWHIDINSKLAVLGRFSLIPNPAQLQAYLRIYTSNIVHYFDCVPGTYLLGGDAIEAVVYKNGFPFAKIPFATPEIVSAGQKENQPCVLMAYHLLEEKYTFEPETKRSSPVCTCGVKFTGGMCSDWCDLVRKS